MIKQDSLKPLSDAQLEELRRENPEQTLSTLGEQKIQANRDLVRRWQEEKKQFPVLQESDASLKLEASLRDLDRHLSLFREELEYTPIKAAFPYWLNRLHERNRKQYAHYITQFFEKNIIPESFADGKVFTIGGLRHLNHPLVISHIKNLPELTDEEREARTTCYNAFIAYLNHLSYGWFTRAVLALAKENNPTPSKSRGDFSSFSFGDWRTFLDTLCKGNQRDAIIARCLMACPERVSNVLSLQLDQLEFEKNTINFSRTKRNGVNQILSVNYDIRFMQEIRDYVGSTTEQRKESKFVFVTRNGKRVTRSRLNYSLAEASTEAAVKKVTPDSLKKIWTNLIREGIKEEHILRSKKWNLYEKIY